MGNGSLEADQGQRSGPFVGIGDVSDVGHAVPFPALCYWAGAVAVA